METKTVNIDIEIFKKLKIYCAINDIKIRDFVNTVLEKELDLLYEQNKS